MIFWAVANEEKYAKRVPAYFSRPENYIEDDVVGKRMGVVICQADDREGAKKEAAPELGGNPDKYIVHPITREGDRVVLKVKFV